MQIVYKISYKGGISWGVFRPSRTSTKTSFKLLKLAKDAKEEYSFRVNEACSRHYNLRARLPFVFLYKVIEDYRLLLLESINNEDGCV